MTLYTVENAGGAHIATFGTATEAARYARKIADDSATLSLCAWCGRWHPIAVAAVRRGDSRMTLVARGAGATRRAAEDRWRRDVPDDTAHRWCECGRCGHPLQYRSDHRSRYRHRDPWCWCSLGAPSELSPDL